MNYVELNGRVYGGVSPEEAIDALQDIAPQEVFRGYRDLFESLPNMLLFDKIMFVHAGIPRDSTIGFKWVGLSSLNDAEMRFQMLWGDPSDADYLPTMLQESNARFPWGQLQFRKFMSRIGCSSMMHGHERVEKGFKTVYDDGEVMLLKVFSAGGATNNDLPEDSTYRQITPTTRTIRYRDGITQLTPFEIDYARHNNPKYNAFFRTNLT